MTRKIEPATLVAYLDGELRPARAREVEAALARDPALREALQRLERVDTALAAAFDPVLEAPLPALTLTGRPAVAPIRLAFPRQATARLAWAAGIGGLIVGFTAGQMGPSVFEAEEPVAVAAIEEQLPEILETEVSGTTVAFNDPIQGVAGTVRPISTFVNADGSYCRAYEARATDEQGSMTSRGVACRDETGHWVTRILVNAV
jgi:surface antigen